MENYIAYTFRYVGGGGVKGHYVYFRVNAELLTFQTTLRYNFDFI